MSKHKITSTTQQHRRRTGEYQKKLHQEDLRRLKKTGPSDIISPQILFGLAQFLEFESSMISGYEARQLKKLSQLPDEDEFSEPDPELKKDQKSTQHLEDEDFKARSASESSGRYLAIKAIFFLISISSSISVTSAEIDKLGMVKIPEKHLYLDKDNDGTLHSGKWDIFFADTVSQIHGLKGNQDPTLHEEGNSIFKNTALHHKIANGRNEVAFAILEKFSDKIDKIRLVQDTNKCTPLLLSMKMGSPTKLVLKLINKESVKVPDKDGITPLMLAARGMDIKIIAKIKKLMSPEEWEKALKQKDNNGRSVKDWSKISVAELQEYFMKSQIDFNRSSNCHHNALFHATLADFRFPKSSVTEEVCETLSITTTAYFINNAEYRSFLATKENADKLYKILNAKKEDSGLENQKNYQKKLLLLKQIASPTQKLQYLEKIKKILISFKDDIAPESLKDVYVSNQKKIHDFINTPSKSPEKPEVKSKEKERGGYEL